MAISRENSGPKNAPIRAGKPSAAFAPAAAAADSTGRWLNNLMRAALIVLALTWLGPPAAKG